MPTPTEEANELQVDVLTHGEIFVSTTKHKLSHQLNISTAESLKTSFNQEEKLNGELINKLDDD